MSDEQLRLLARDVEQGGSTRARLLATRLRMGLLDLERLRLAAYCRDADASAVIGERRSAVFMDRLCLWPYGKTPAVIAAIAAARELEPLWKALGEAEPFQAIAAAQAWVLCPCDDHRREAVAVSDQVVRVGRARGIGDYVGRPAWHAVQAAARADRNEREARRAARRASREARDSLSHAIRIVHRMQRIPTSFMEVRGITLRSMCESVHEALREWALREG